MIRIIGPTGSRRRSVTLLTALVSLVLVALVLAPAALAVSDDGTVDVQVPDKTKSDRDKMTSAGAFVSYFGDSDTTFGASGTGTFDPFVRVQADPNEDGFNTDANVELDTKAGKWTHSILVSQIPQRACPEGLVENSVPQPAGPPPPPDLLSLTCFELFVDINESNTDKQIALNDLEIWFAPAPDGATITGYPFTSAQATKVYDFNGAVLVNDVNQGSGRADVRYDIPIGLIDGGIPTGCYYGAPLGTCNTYFVLYSQWGTGPSAAWDSEGGFEEWKVRKYPTKSGVKFNDYNGNGVKDTNEPGIAGVTIRAYGDTNGNGTLDTAEATTANIAVSAVTDSTGTYSLTFPAAGKYIVCEVLPAGFVQSAPSNSVCSAGSSLTPPLGAGGYAETVAQDSRLTGNNFGNRQGSLIIRKEGKDARTAATNDLLGGATFKVTPNPFTGTGFLTITDVSDGSAGTNDAYNSTAGVICIDQVVPGTYSVQETAAPANYNKASPDTQTGISTGTTNCATRAGGNPATATADVTFVNTPLSEITVKFKSLADGNTTGTGVTRASIVCATGGTAVAPVTENATADPATDDYDETFTSLAPGTYTCTVVVDP